MLVSAPDVRATTKYTIIASAMTHAPRTAVMGPDRISFIVSTTSRAVSNDSSNFARSKPLTTAMTTQHYQIVERYFRFETSNTWVGYDGSGYTVQLKWTKEGTGYTGLWKVKQMVEVHQGDGHLGIPPDSGLLQFQAFINAQRTVGGLAPFLARRQLSDWKPPKRKLQGNPVTCYEDFLQCFQPRQKTAKS